MKEIKLTKGLSVQVDDCNYQWLNQWNWYAQKGHNTYYAARRDKNCKLIYMHRIILDTPENLQVDHKDHNGLNCQGYNIRNCTHQQNQMNQSSRCASGYLGVRKTPCGNFRANIKTNDKCFYIGTYKTKELAALAYNNKAIQLFGEFANLNNVL